MAVEHERVSEREQDKEQRVETMVAIIIAEIRGLIARGNNNLEGSAAVRHNGTGQTRPTGSTQGLPD